MTMGMVSPRKRTRLGLALAVLLTGAMALGYGLMGTPDRPVPVSALPVPPGLFQSGDVLLRGSEDSIWSRMARQFSTRKDGFGHMGLIDVEPMGVFVIHASGTPVDPDGSVQKTTLAEFLTGADRIALLRPDLDSEAVDRMLHYARTSARQNLPFDRAFSLDTEDAQYCTEFIWRGLNAALGEDAIPDKSTYAGRVYIAIDDIQDSPWLTEIMRMKLRQVQTAGIAYRSD